MQSFHKHLITAVAVLAIFSVGFFAGCSQKPQTSAQTKTAQQTSSSMPEQVKGVHNVSATGTIDVAFSPHGGITTMIVDEISKAKQSIQIQAYSFTSQPIMKALTDAKKRGVDVRIIIDKSNIEGTDSRGQHEKELLNSLMDSGIAMKVDSEFQIAHSKVMIIDSQDVITGSFNFTASAENNNAENCLVLHSNKALAAEYIKNWQWRWDATANYSK